MSSNIAIQRIKREFIEVSKIDEVNQNLISIEAVNDSSLVDLRGKITGPPDTPYENGTFVLEIKIPEVFVGHLFIHKIITFIFYNNRILFFLDISFQSS